MDIEAVLVKLAARRPEFNYMGFVMRDFTHPAPGGGFGGKTCWSRYCDPATLGSAITPGKLNALIVNTDTYSGAGKHWTCLLFDARPRVPGVFYYDPVGRRPARAWLSDGTWRTIFEGLSMAVGRRAAVAAFLDARYNPTRHQRGRSECGMFTLYLCHSILQDGDFARFCENGLGDKDVEKLRAVYFKLNCDHEKSSTYSSMFLRRRT